MLQCRRMWERLLVTFILRRTIAHCTVVERDRSSVLDLLAISSFTVRLSLCANNVYIVVDFVFTLTVLHWNVTQLALQNLSARPMFFELLYVAYGLTGP